MKPPIVAQAVPEPLSTKLVELAEQVEQGTRDLEQLVDELHPRFQEALRKGRDNLDQVREYIERLAKSVERTLETDHE
jgi:ABC-type transporter Mla subunit MlaD